MQRSSPSQILVVTDGHAGNLRQARALADALKLPTQDIVLAPRAPWRWVAPRRVGGAERAFGAEFEALACSAFCGALEALGSVMTEWALR